MPLLLSPPPPSPPLLFSLVLFSASAGGCSWDSMVSTGCCCLEPSTSFKTQVQFWHFHFVIQTSKLFAQLNLRFWLAASRTDGAPPTAATAAAVSGAFELVPSVLVSTGLMVLPCWKWLQLCVFVKVRQTAAVAVTIVFSAEVPPVPPALVTNCMGWEF